MNMNLRKKIFNLAMLSIVFMAVMSVNGAFLGAERAKVFFNSAPMAVFWCVLLILMAASLFLYPRLRRQPVLFLIHLGCCLVLAGGLWGSNWSHRSFGAISLSKGYLLLQEGHTSQMLFDEAMTGHEKLPFSVKLVKTWLTFYEDADPALDGMIKDYYSTVQILEGDAVVAEATIEMNKPLYYGGYHFYYTDPIGSFNALMVTSSRGVLLVFIGYAMIFAALAWHCWGRVCRSAMSELEGRLC